MFPISLIHQISFYVVFFENIFEPALLPEIYFQNCQAVSATASLKGQRKITPTSEYLDISGHLLHIELYRKSERGGGGERFVTMCLWYEHMGLMCGTPKRTSTVCTCTECCTNHPQYKTTKNLPLV